MGGRGPQARTASGLEVDLELRQERPGRVVAAEQHVGERGGGIGRRAQADAELGGPP